MAVNRAMAELDFAPGELPEDHYDVTILVPPEEGFLGVGGVDAQVEVTLREEALENLPEPEGVEAGGGPFGEDASEATAAAGTQSAGGREEDEWLPRAGSAKLREMLELILEKLDLEAEVTVEETADSLTATVEGEELGLLIGKRGQTLDAVEYLASIILYPDPDVRKAVDIDASGYKERRRTGIERIASNKAQEAVRRRRAVELGPMTPAERKIVHILLRDRPDVTTESTGKEPERRVVIRPSS